ncbi:MAG: NAD(P)/FAD-dependent oxidoreductase [Acidobacteriia bacterium]|nr:NAD(P)/FAD-dependent oxidoreductase [Terriglobia bacterium]
MKKVAILGGGPAGAIAAERLAQSGLHTVLIDEKLAWEKPCGGGITYKAYSQYPFLLDNDTPKRMVSETYLSAPNAGRVKMALTRPMAIYSRFDLNHMLLDRAEKAGAQLEKVRVSEILRQGCGWALRTRHGVIDADFCVVATGARNPLREVGTAWTSSDTMYALGYYVPSNQYHIDIQFLSRLEGYVWVFPRCGHLSVGICGKGESAQSLRARLEHYMREHEISWKGAQFYAHMLPALEPRSWKGNRLSGDGWMAVGDAGGLVDPITGEGLYYAMRSADLASQILLDDAHAPHVKPAAYRSVIEHDFAKDLYLGSLIARRLFTGNFLLGSVPARMVQFVRRSPRFRELMQDIFAGTQTYEDLSGRLLRNLNGTLQEVLMSFFFRRILPEPSKS